MSRRPTGPPCSRPWCAVLSAASEPAGALTAWLLVLVVVFSSGAAAEPAFVEVAAARGLDFIGEYGPAFSEVTGEWPAMYQRNMGNGAAVGDYDGDGDLDVYLLGQLGWPNRLYRNNLETGAKTFTEVTPEGLDDLGLSRVAHFADLDGDGDLDLLLINDDAGTDDYPASKIFRNDGGAAFTDVTAGSGFRPVGYLRAGCALADYDRDGLLDVYVTVWALKPPSGPPFFLGSNRLYRNLGGLRFEDVTDSVGLGTLESNSFSAVFTDFGGDFFPDLYVALDVFSDEFYFNQGGTFSLATATVGTTHVGNDMGVAAADFDDDGDLDLYTTNITDLGPPPNIGAGRFNVLYVNQQDALGETAFVDLAVEHGVEDTYWGWGVELVDADNDGDLDLAAVNGFDEWVRTVAGEASYLYRTPSVLLVNDGAGQYDRLTGAGLDDPDDSRALVAFDYDRDGDQDLLVTNVNQPVRLYENVTAGGGHWLDVALSPDDLAIGARLYATTGAVTRRRDVIAGRSYLAGTPSEVHFGLGDSPRVDTLRIVWANGSEQILRDVDADRLLRLTPMIFADGFESGDLSAWTNTGGRHP